MAFIASKASPPFYFPVCPAPPSAVSPALSTHRVPSRIAPTVACFAPPAPPPAFHFASSFESGRAVNFSWCFPWSSKQTISSFLNIIQLTEAGRAVIIGKQQGSVA